MTTRLLVRSTLAALALSFAAPLSSAGANEFDAELRDLATKEIAQWASDPVVVAAIRKQNGVTANYSADQIQALDKAWRAEVDAKPKPTIDPVLHNAASDFLRQQRDKSAGLFTEIFVMDARGLNVATSDVTTDYWQGDEAKWKNTYPKGVGAIDISDIELDESTQTYQSQVSLAVADPETGSPIGAVTVGVNVEHIH